MNRDARLHKIGYDIGWDMAFYGQPCPRDGEPALVQGYRDCLKQRGRAQRRHADKFDRRWLRLRRGAWQRERYFSKDVTPQYLKRIYSPLCPVTWEPLTDSAGLPTDWTVDRVNNDAAYAPGNLVVMSLRANQAKGALTLPDVVRILQNNERPPALTEPEWLRLVYLMVRPCSLGTDQEVIPCLTFLPPGLRFAFSDVVQFMLCMHVQGGEGACIGLIKRYCRTQNEQKLYAKLLKRLRHALPRVKSKLELMGQPGVFEAFMAWYTGLPLSQRKALELAMTERFKLEYTPAGAVDKTELCLASRGYLPFELPEALAA